MKVRVISLFPEMFQAITEYGVSGRAVNRSLVDIEILNPRDFTEDRHQTVDDRPYGGGPGMVMMVEPLQKAIATARHSLIGVAAEAEKLNSVNKGEMISSKNCPVIYLSPQGKKIDQQKIQQLAELESFILLAGRYEGVDERLIAQEVDEELSLGDFVLSGGEIAAMAVIDAVIRLTPGALGHEDSAKQDSFSGEALEGLLDCPHYTRPEVYQGEQVPEVLLSGNHKAIELWRMQQSLARTWQRRPDLLQNKQLTKQQQKLLDEFIASEAGSSDEADQ